MPGWLKTIVKKQVNSYCKGRVIADLGESWPRPQEGTREASVLEEFWASIGGGHTGLHGDKSTCWVVLLVCFFVCNAS